MELLPNIPRVYQRTALRGYPRRLRTPYGDVTTVLRIFDVVVVVELWERGNM